MSLQGILLIDLLSLGLIVLIANLVRTKRLYVGYALVWILAVVALMVIVSVPPLLYMLPSLVGAVYPASAIALMAFVFIFLVLIYMSVKLTTLSNRQVELIQLLALRELQERGEGGSQRGDRRQRPPRSQAQPSPEIGITADASQGPSHAGLR